jgi:hypothetical protein
MKKIRVSIEIDVSTGEYELTWNNLSNPGESIDLYTLIEATRRVVNDFGDRQTGKVETTAAEPVRGDN